MAKAYKLFFFVLLIGAVFLFSFSSDKQKANYYSPIDFQIVGNNLFVAEYTSKSIKKIDRITGALRAEQKLDLAPQAILVSGNAVYTVCSYAEGELIISDAEDLKTKSVIKVGQGASDVVLSPNGKMAYVSNAFSNDVSIVDLEARKEIKRIPVLRQPMVVEISRNGKYLFVANFLTAGRADADTVTAEVSIIDLDESRVIKNIPLANGSNALRGICLSDDGKYVFISHNLGRFQVPTTQLEQGWMNTSALSIIDAGELKYVATVLLDEPEYGAAGSWGIDCTPENILVAHSGTHDFSVINYQRFVEKLESTEKKEVLSYDLRFLSDIRKRIPVTGNGPRTIKGIGSKVYVANYFSDQIDIVDLNKPIKSNYKEIVLNDNLVNDTLRLGEIFFNDAQYCFQGWQSCNGCHPNHARTDGLNWDLLNDGIGNPKNCKSMLFAHKTPPAMISGIRPNAETAVRAGFRYIQFAQVEEPHARAVDVYLKSLEPVPSPLLIDGELSDMAKEGKKVFERVGCVYCHPAPYFSDGKMHEIGTQSEFDRQNTWDTPTLREVWRSGPYLHDGRCATITDVLAVEKHGIGAEIADAEIDALAEYVLSL